MPVDHSKNGFFKDLGSDWLAIAANGAPIARAATEDGVRRAAPNAAEYVTGKKEKAAKAADPEPVVEPAAVEPEPAVVDPEPAPTVEPEAEQPEQVDAVEPEPVAEEPAAEPEPALAVEPVATGRRKRKPAE